MNEELLHFIWQQKLFDLTDLTITDGESLTIINSGLYNNHSGPDFTQARIRINSDILAGNIEIHKKSSDWIKHNHQFDKAYSNVILHVVYEHDRNNHKLNLPTLELRERIDTKLLARYDELMNSANWIPCEPLISKIDKFSIKNGMHRLLVERLERKTGEIIEKLDSTKQSWEETFYQIAARNFGLKVNADAFELLARSLPINIIAKHKNNPFQIESLLFGQAGMLDDNFIDDYPNQLKREYKFLQKKYKLSPIPSHVWKFMRLRPASFPTIRIAQFATLIYQSSHLFSKITDVKNVDEIFKLFDVKPTEYWLTHYRFGVQSKKSKKQLGKDFISNFTINAIVPVLFVNGKRKGNQTMEERALNLLEQVSSEKNSIISKWQSLGIMAASAYESQALLQLKNEYCNHKRCLNCFIGNKLLRTANET